MLDQMFTAENFRRIYDSENRKGLDLAGLYFPALEPYTLAVREKVQEIRAHRSKEASVKAEDFKQQLDTLKAELAHFKAAKSAAVDQIMDNLSLEVLKPSFKIELSQKSGPKGKSIYCIDSKPETFFVIKQLQHNIHRIYGVKQASRHDLVCQVRDMVCTKFPFEIVRTDISTFYESIDRRRLVKKLDKDQLLSSSSKKFINQILDSYGKLSGTSTGIPRGVGISSYLAELYLQPVDKAIRAIPGLALYCRYVDDVVAIFARPPTGTDLGSYKNHIIEVFAENGLTHNPDKTYEFELLRPTPKKFEYLGYRFLIQSGQCQINASAAKVLKYRKRMDAAFKDYWKCCSTDSRGAYRELVARIKFLTGNTRLLNSKSRATTGIYYSNPLVNDFSSFLLLDKRLKAQIIKIRRPRLRNRLKAYKFTDGFKERRFHNFNSRELQTIVRAWKHG